MGEARFGCCDGACAPIDQRSNWFRFRKPLFRCGRSNRAPANVYRSCLAAPLSRSGDLLQGAVNFTLGRMLPHAITLVVPSITKGLDDRNYRVKEGSLQALCIVAHRAPVEVR